EGAPADQEHQERRGPGGPAERLEERFRQHAADDAGPVRDRLAVPAAERPGDGVAVAVGDETQDEENRERHDDDRDTLREDAPRGGGLAAGGAPAPAGRPPRGFTLA